MPDKIPFSEFTFKGTTYVLKDAVARAAIENLNSFEYIVCTSANDTPQDVIWNNIVGTLVPSEDTKYKIYLVPSSNGTNDLYDEYITVQNGANLTWEKFGNTDINLSDYVTKDNPTFTGSLSLGRKANTATGPNSVAIGMNATATGVNSYATGNNVVASGNQAFSEGTSTIAASTNQHAQGKYNIADTNNTYAEIVGNGTNDANRSNAYALDWNGNARFAGDVYVGCNDNSTGGTKLATIEDIPDVPVQDVQVNGVSVLNQNGTANVPKASSSQLGVVGIDPQSGVDITSNGKLELNPASTDDIKRGENINKPIVPFKQDAATFYGLAKAAGDDTQSASSNAVGTYTDAAKSAIREMIGAGSEDIISVQDTQPTSTDNILWINGTPGSPIQVPTVSEMNAALDDKIDDVQVNGTSVVTNGVANVPVASGSKLGTVKVGSAYGIQILSDGEIRTNPATDNNIKLSNASNAPIVPQNQHLSTFYGLAKAAGDSTQSQSDNAVGIYTDSAKSAIREMLDVPSNNIVMVQDSRPDDADNVLWIRDTAPASIQVPTVSEMESYVNAAVANINSMNIHICTSSEYNAQTGIPTVQNPDTTTFYLVPGGQSPNLYIEWVYTNNAWEQFGSATIDLSDYVQKTDYANSSVGGTVKIDNGNYGISIDSSSGLIKIVSTNVGIKNGANLNVPVVAANEYIATFYGLAKAAGADMASSNNSVGTYTDAAKTAIQNMLGVQPGTEVVRLI